MKKDKGRYITLKEAAKISGYAPDYIGQLIRAGKLPGKQIYRPVAWVTTDGSLRNYTQKNSSKVRRQSFVSSAVRKMREAKNRFALRLRAPHLIRALLYLVIVTSLGFSVMLFYVLSINFEKRLQQNAIQTIGERYVKTH